MFDGEDKDNKKKSTERSSPNKSKSKYLIINYYSKW